MPVTLETLKLELGAALSATPAQAAWLWTDEPPLLDDNGRFAARRAGRVDHHRRGAELSRTYDELRAVPGC